MVVQAILCSVLMVSMTATIVACQCHNNQATVGFFFSCQIVVDGNSPSVMVSARERGLAGLPAWLSVGQFNTSSPAYLYGTPTSTSQQKQLAIEITALNTITFESQTRDVIITIIPSQDTVILEHELYIDNFELLELLHPDVQTSLQSTLIIAYPTTTTSTPSVVRIDHASSIGIPISPPPAKQGVVVVVTPGLDVDNPTLSSCTEQMTGAFLSSGFSVVSCSASMLVSIDSPTTEGAGPEIDTPTRSESRISLLVILVVGGIVLFMVVTGLAFVFFSSRKNGVLVSRTRKSHQITMHNVSKETTKGPVRAQVHLRDIAKPTPRGAPSGDSSNARRNQNRPLSVTEEALLEFQDLTDYHSRGSSPRPLPPYTHPNISYITQTDGVAI